MLDLTIRPAKTDDYDAFATLFPELATGDALPTPSMFASDIVPLTLFAERDGRIVGYAFFRITTHATTLIHLVTAPAARRTGVGAALTNAVVARGRAAGSKELILNVKPDNAGAIRLYESLGLRPVHRSRALLVPWALIEASSGDLATHVIAPAEDEPLEAALDLPKGILADLRGRGGRFLHAIGTQAACVFWPAFPGANPFRAPDLPHALALLRAVRPHARPADDSLTVLIEGNPDLADSLLSMGATPKLEVLHMRGPIV